MKSVGNKLVFFLLLCLWFSTQSNISVSYSSSSVIYVPGDYELIQKAIDAASPGDKIIVDNGTYSENIVIDKSISVLGLGAVIESTRGDAVKIISNGVEFRGFKIFGSASSNVGIYVRSSGAFLTNNTVSGFLFGIMLYDSKRIVLRNNLLMDNKFNLEVWGLTIEHFFHDIDSSNLVDGKKVYYLVNATGETVPRDAGYVAVVNSSKVIVANISITSNGEGILVAYSRNCMISNVEVSACNRGVRLIASDNNSITFSSFYGNFWAGIVLDSSHFNEVYRNLFSSNHAGVLVSSSILLNLISEKNMIEENQMYDNTYGLYLRDARDNQLIRNFLKTNYVGTFIEYGEGNIFYGNIFSNNSIGIQLHISKNNTIYHNSFIKNSMHVEIQDALVSKNAWNSSYPFGGNYWDDFLFNDSFSGPLQNLTGSDGIADGLRYLNEYNIDFYPVGAPPSFIDLFVGGNQKFSIVMITSSEFNDFNYSLLTRSFGFSLSEIKERGFCRVSLPKKLFWCDGLQDWIVTVNGTDSLDYVIFEDEQYTYFLFEYEGGSYHISILATYSFWGATSFGDVNHDGYVDFRDLLQVVASFGSYPGHSRWNSWADLDGSSQIDIKDVLMEIKALLSCFNA